MYGMQLQQTFDDILKIKPTSSCRSSRQRFNPSTERSNMSMANRNCWEEAHQSIFTFAFSAAHDVVTLRQKRSISVTFLCTNVLFLFHDHSVIQQSILAFNNLSSFLVYLFWLQSTAIFSCSSYEASRGFFDHKKGWTSYMYDIQT